MPILNYTSTVAASKTQGEVTSLLARKGVRRISTVYDERGGATGLAFTVDTELGLRDFEVPVRTAEVARAMGQDPEVPPRLRSMEQAERVAWRILKDWVEAQMAFIEAGMSSLHEVMLPYMLAPNGDRFFPAYITAQRALEAPETSTERQP